MNKQPQERLTDEEMESLQNVVSNTLANICTMADKHNIDRDSMLKYFADMITGFAEVASIKNYKASRSCNCKHNHNSNSDEPCCRCDRQMTNADRIRNMSNEELAEFIVGLNNHCLAGIGECDCSDESVANCEEICNRKTFMWLQSPAEVSETDNLEVRR